MIEEVEAFEKKFLAKMPTNELETELATKLTKAIEELDKKLHNLEKEPTKYNKRASKGAFRYAEYL